MEDNNMQERRVGEWPSLLLSCVSEGQSWRARVHFGACPVSEWRTKSPLQTVPIMHALIGQFCQQA
jgi:hypothetical protein